MGTIKNDIGLELKNFVDFTYSLVNMDEIRDGLFIKPKEISFELTRDIHQKIHVEVKRQKNDDNFEDINEPFEVEILGVNFKFLIKE